MLLLRNQKDINASTPPSPPLPSMLVPATPSCLGPKDVIDYENEADMASTQMRFSIFIYLENRSETGSALSTES